MEQLDLSGVERVLVVTAHPDDVDFGFAGSVAVMTDARAGEGRGVKGEGRGAKGGRATAGRCRAARKAAIPGELAVSFRL